MQTGYVVFFLFLPLLLEGCCVENDKKKSTGLQGDVTHCKTVMGEVFMMPCYDAAEEIWSRTGEDTDGSEDTSFRCGRKFLAEPKHSGTYTCLTCGSKPSFHLQVVEKNSLKCFCTEESSKILQVGAGGEIPCPGLNCSDNTNVKWYQVKNKSIKAVSEQRRASCEQDGWLHLYQVHKQDTGVYFCDRQIIEQGATWIFRRAVNVTTIPPGKPRMPRIIRPSDNSTEEVELGQSHTLACQIYFPYEKKEGKKVREVQWYVSLGGNMESMTRLEDQARREEEAMHYEDKFTQTAVIKEVKLQHLNNTYTCFARNSVGNSSVTVKLKNKNKVRWPSLIGYPVAPLLLLAGLGIMLHVKRLDLQLIFRYYFQLGKHNTDDKKFDVLLSYMWSPTSELEGVSTHPSKSGLENDEEALSSMDPRNSLRPLEVLLPQVLEDQWGYRLCLLERDVLPGGAYTNDIVLSIQRSQMLICLLSADYLSDSNAVFVLESGVQALLNNSALKLLLIWTNRSSACQIEIDPPLPTLVQRALKVLPSLDWASGKPVRGTSNFWRSLQKAMPRHRVQQISH